MKKVLVKSNQPNIIATHRGSPSYEIEFGNTPVEVSEDIAKHLIDTNHNFSIVSEVETEIKEIDLDYKKELEDIKGIGPKTAEEIMTMFKTKTSLIEAIERGDDLYASLDDDVVDLLKEKYGGEK